MNVSQKDREILRELGKQYAEIAFSEEQKKKKEGWIRLNALQEERPKVMIDQLPWHELNTDHELDCKCEDEDCGGIEWALRSELYRLKHFPVDRVPNPYIPKGKWIHDDGYGVTVQETRLVSGSEYAVASHAYKDILSTEEDLEKLHPVKLVYEEKATLRDKKKMEEIFEGILPVKLVGQTPYFNVWDEIAIYRGVTPILMDLIDRPEFTHKMVEKFTNIWLDRLDQLERLNALEPNQSEIHCAGAFTKELANPRDPENCSNAKECWGMGMAQLFSSCSSEMHDEFEIAYAKKYYGRVGLVNYGCCEPLHNKVDIIRQIPNVRKISMSPWADPDIGAYHIGSDYVMTRKPNPAYLASDAFDEEAVINETKRTLEACKRNHTPCEFILKDISTVHGQPERLTRWAELVNQTIDKYY